MYCLCCAPMESMKHIKYNCSIGVFTIRKSVRSDKEKMLSLEIITIEILQIKVISGE